MVIIPNEQQGPDDTVVPDDQRHPAVDEVTERRQEAIDRLVRAHTTSPILRRLVGDER